jgi:excisionase family DNA binding protein
MSTHRAEGYEVERRALRPLLTVNGAAEYLSVTRWQVYRLVRTGALRPLRVGSRLRFRVEELDRYVEREAQ